MRLRFETSVATVRGYFHAGRVIEVAKLTLEMQDWVDRGVAVLVPIEDAREVAVAPNLPAHAVTSSIRPSSRRRTRQPDSD